MLKKRITVAVAAEIHDRLCELAEADGRNSSTVAEILLCHATLTCRDVSAFRSTLDKVRVQVQSKGKQKPSHSNPTLGRSGRGVIEAIKSVLLDARQRNSMYSVQEILAKVVARCGNASIVTIHQQLSRLPREQGFEIRKSRDGRVMRYAAA